jgi:hypothetical protein
MTEVKLREKKVRVSAVRQILGFLETINGIPRELRGRGWTPNTRVRSVADHPIKSMAAPRASKKNRGKADSIGISHGLYWEISDIRTGIQV